MTAIPSNKKFIQIEEMEYRKSVSESTFQKLGGAVNYLNDNTDKVLVKYDLSAGSYSFTVPEGVNQIEVFAVSGGAGSSFGAPADGVKSSGAGGILNAFLKVTPLETLTINVGAGGAASGVLGQGASGGTTSISGYFSISGGTGSTALAPITSGVSGKPSISNYSKVTSLGFSERVYVDPNESVGDDGPNSTYANGGSGSSNVSGGAACLQNGGAGSFPYSGSGAGYLAGGTATKGGDGKLFLSLYVGSGVTINPPA